MTIRHKLTRKFYRYSIDLINDREIRGWCFHRLNKTRPVHLAIYMDNDQVGDCVANQLRSDLKSHGLHPDGRCGFQFKMPPGINLDAHRQFSVRAEPGPVELFKLGVEQIPRIVDETSARVLFMHIPKTAGTSFNTFARAYFPQDQTVTQAQTRDPREYPGFNASFRFISGHLTLGALKAHFDLDKFSLYTILREPYRHLHSHFNWVKAVASSPDSGFSHEHPEVVREMALKMQHLQLDKPAELERFVAGLSGFALDFFDNCQTRYFLDQRPQKVTPQHLEQALENLAHFRAIGTTERYEDFTRLFCTQIGADYCMQKAPLNRARIAPLFDINAPGIREILKPLVATDLQLYAHVQDRLAGAPR